MPRDPSSKISDPRLERNLISPRLTGCELVGTFLRFDFPVFVLFAIFFGAFKLIVVESNTIFVTGFVVNTAYLQPCLKITKN